MSPPADLVTAAIPSRNRSIADVADRPSTASDVKYDGLSFVGHMIAGAVAGTVEHTAMYPVDTIKTRMQALSQPGQRLHRLSVIEAMRTALRREGISGLYKGVGAVAGGAGPAHAMHFAVYELAKDRMGGNQNGGHHPAIAAAAGAMATVVNEAVMTPTDVVKQRLQMSHSPYRNTVDCVVKMAQKEGLAGFFKSYPTTLLMSIPFQAIHFSVYEGTKKILLEPVLWRHYKSGTSTDTSISTRSDAPGQTSGSPACDEDALEDSLSTQLVAGGLAGGVAAALTTPFDVVKTRLQTQGVHSATQYGSSSLLAVMRRIVADEGAQALWRGIKPRVMFNVPAAAVSWGTYETLKTFLAGVD